MIMDKIYAVLPEKLGTISPLIYGVFSEHIGGVIYDGIYVGEDAKAENIHGFRKFIIDKIKEAKIPLIRWPGGCFAEIYDWRDGIGPKEDRPVRINWWTVNDHRYEPNQVGTDEFMDFCRMCEAEPYFAANITTTTPLDIRDWIDYCNSPAGTTTMAKLREKNGHKEPYGVKYWGVGNETWGGGGNMTPESYALQYRRYAEIMHNTDPSIELIASGASGGDYHWTQDLLKTVNNTSFMDGMSFHHYSNGKNEDPVNFNEEEWYCLLGNANRMQELIERHWGTALSYKEEKRAGLCVDEWGAWHRGGSGPSKGFNLFEQQSTMRDAVLSALTLNIFNNECDKVKLATVAQLVNNLHALFLAGGENCIVTPTYHVFDMFKAHQGAEAVRTIAESAACPDGLPGISVSASVKDGVFTLTAANIDYKEDKVVAIEALGGKFAGKATVTTMSADDLTAHNTFEEPEKVKPITKEIDDFDGTLKIPHGAIVTLSAKLAD